MIAAKLHPEIAPLFATMVAACDPPMETREPQAVRALMDGFARDGMPPRPDTVVTEDLVAELPGRSIRLRLFKPRDATGPLPIMLYFHGGGWVIGNIDTHDRYVCALTEASGVAYFAVDYRLAPEHPYPAAIDDCYDALCWIAENAARLGLDATRIGVSGDSAGGQLSAACTFLARKHGTPKLSFQLLIYPLTDRDTSRPSYHSWDNLLLTTPYMEWFWRHFYGEGMPTDTLVVPLQEPDLTGLPPAYVVTCEFDILRDEGELYAHRLMEAGVSTTLRRVPGGAHPFFRAMFVSPMVRAEIREMGHQIRRYLVEEAAA